MGWITPGPASDFIWMMTALTCVLIMQIHRPIQLSGDRPCNMCLYLRCSRILNRVKVLCYQHYAAFLLACYYAIIHGFRKNGTKWFRKAYGNELCDWHISLYVYIIIQGAPFVDLVCKYWIIVMVGFIIFFWIQSSTMFWRAVVFIPVLEIS